MTRPFRGTINLDLKESNEDWDAFLPAPAPAGAPNVLVVLYDDTGQAAWSPYGGRIQMPTPQRLADAGLTYSQWHTTALCSPTRSCFLTGRNHHQNGFASISETATGFPGYSSHIPPENAPMAHVLRDAGWSTFWVGIFAEVELADPDAQGVIFAQGSRFGGHALFLKDRRLHYVYNFLGIGEEQTWVAAAPAPGRHIFGVAFAKEAVDAEHQPTGTTTLYVDDQAVATGPMRVMALQFSLCGEGLCIGYDGGDAVSGAYTPRFSFTGGEIVQVVFDLADDQYVDVERELSAALARD